MGSVSGGTARWSRLIEGTGIVSGASAGGVGGASVAVGSISAERRRRRNSSGGGMCGRERLSRIRRMPAVLSTRCFSVASSAASSSSSCAASSSKA